ncbi:MAG: AraC family transcriptional regulator [Bacteroidales bacterium]|nr:AraC family transcriptional regulator [Bacteroidales bacterium]
MSWAGKKNIIDRFRGLLRKEQAPPALVPLSDKELRLLDRITREWVNGKGYRMADRTVDTAAQRMGTTSILLHRYCLQRMGKDFRTWRTELRMEDAKQMLLEEPKTTASCIGRRVGVTDRSNFFRQFTAYTGSSPEQWRQSNL